MTPDAFRKLALQLPGTTEGEHMGHADFRVVGKMNEPAHRRFALLRRAALREPALRQPADHDLRVLRHESLGRRWVSVVSTFRNDELMPGVRVHPDRDIAVAGAREIFAQMRRRIGGIHIPIKRAV